MLPFPKFSKVKMNPKYSFVNKTFSITFGLLCSLFFIGFMILSIPVYIYRCLVALLAKIFRHDLREILSGVNAGFISDYFADHPPRSNIVIAVTFNGQVTFNEVKAKVLKRWIQRDSWSYSGVGKVNYKKFRQYPVKWMGFTFWKDARSTFSIDNHVHMLAKENVQISENQLNSVCEKLLNSRIPSEQSPWEIYVAENYRPATATNDSIHSVLIIKIHHILTDGYGITIALTEGLFEDMKFITQTVPRPRPVQMSPCQKFFCILMWPISVLLEMSYALSQNFQYSHWKIPDHSKAWELFQVRLAPIPIQVIKDIKNAFEVSFSSVLLSAVSAALHEMGKKMNKNGISIKNNDSAFCCNILMEPGRDLGNILTNEITGIAFDLPTKYFSKSSERLSEVGQMLRVTNMSAKLFLARLYSKLAGAHCNPVASLASYNKMCPVALSNMFGSPLATFNGKSVADLNVMLGCFTGEAGIAVLAVTFGDKVKIGLTTEKGLISKEEAELISSYIADEIHILHKLVTMSVDN